MLSIYQNRSGFRVVAGKHAIAQEHKGLQPRVYDTAASAFATEVDPEIRAAILRIDPTAADDSTPAGRHFMSKTEERRALKPQAGNASLVLLVVLALFLLAPVCGGFYHVHFHAHDCGALAVLAFLVLLVKAVRS